MPKRWSGFACAIAVSLLSAYNSAGDGCLLTKHSFIKTFCENIYSSSSTCFDSSSKQPRGFIEWKVQFIALKTLGELSGTMLAGKYSLANGRRSTVLSGYILTCIGLLCAVLITNSWFVLGTRFLIGVGNGLIAGPVLVWVSETFDVSTKGLEVTAIQISKCSGQLVAAICVWLISDWRFSSSLAVIPLPIIVTATCLGYWPESSAEMGSKEADTLAPSCRECFNTSTTNRNSSKDFIRGQSNAETTSLLDGKGRGPSNGRKEAYDEVVAERGLLSDASLRLRLFLCCCLFIVNVLSGANAIQSYGSSIIEEAGVSDGNLAEAVVFAFNLFGTVVNMFIIEKTNRKSMLMYGTLLMAVLLLGAPILYVAKTSTATIDVIFPIIICIFLFVNAFAVGPVKYVYVSEVFPPELKTYAVQIILFAEIVTSTVASYTLYMIAEIGISISFSIMSLVGLTGAIIIYFLAIETLNKTFLEVDHLFTLSYFNKYFKPCSSSSGVLCYAKEESEI